MLLHSSRETVAIVQSMENDDRPAPDPETVERPRRMCPRRALVFGVVMATLQMGVLLYFMYC